MPVFIRRMLGVAPVIALGFFLLLPLPGFAQTPPAKPDLVVTSVSSPPTTALPGDSFIVSVTVRNQGTVAAPTASLTKFFIVNTSGTIVKNLKGVQNVSALAASASESADVTLAVYSDTVPGTYQMLACADGGGGVSETTESNNCRLATGNITVNDIPDLRITAVDNPPVSVGLGGGFTISSTVQNFGPVAAPATNTRYYLVILSAGAPATQNCLSQASLCKKLKGGVAVPGLGVNGTFTHADLLRVDEVITPLGTYRLQACADGSKLATEDDELNNCKTSTTNVQVTPVPDLTVTSTAVVTPVLPNTVNAGTSIRIQATVKNQGTAQANASTMKFVLVKTGTCVPGNGCSKNLKGTAPINLLAPTATQNVDLSVEVDDDTLSAAYNVQACVDSLKVVGESSEGNNCGTAPGVLTVVGVTPSTADLVVTSVTSPPATGVAGDSFSVTASVRNDGTGQASATQTKFYLVGPGGTPRKNLKGVQPIGLLNGGATSNPAATVEVFSDTVPGAYTLEACADGGETLAEINENNNCKQATGQITIQQVPNLTVTSLLDPPTSVGQGLSFDVNTTVKNIGLVKAKASEVKFNLVSVADSSRKDLKNKLAVPELNPDAEFSDQFTVVVRPETVPGSYRLEACADSGKIVPEQEENDNCKITTGTVTVTGTPDLIVQSVTVPAGTPSIKRGTTFVVTSIVKNQGLGNSGGIGTTTKFTLVKVNAAAVTKTLTPIQAVQALAAGASSAALQTTVTIPATTLVGQYQVQACADSGKALAEAQEGNNCSTSVGKINVTQ